jgi:hypothetical protein
MKTTKLIKFVLGYIIAGSLWGVIVAVNGPIILRQIPVHQLDMGNFSFWVDVMGVSPGIDLTILFDVLGLSFAIYAWHQINVLRKQGVEPPNNTQ